jgi:hypothetical protein
MYIMDQRKRSRRARGGSAKRGAPRTKRSKRRSAPDAPDVPAILGRFSDALSLLAVVQRSLSLQELSGVGDEEITLRRAIEELKAVYDELDSAAPRLRPAAAVRPGAAEADDHE